MQLLIATSNPHKLDEIRAVIGDAPIELLTLDALPNPIDEPVEDQDTFEGNALKKARHYAKQSGWVTVADDSGLQVDTLDGAPGVISARYSGTTGPRTVVDPANNTKLLNELNGVPKGERTARFVCVIAMAWPGNEDGMAEHEPVVVRGEVHGRILLPDETDDPAHPEQGRGANGFGYDPLFALPDDHAEFPGLTTAQLTPEQKNALSHRGVASRALLQALTAANIIA